MVSVRRAHSVRASVSWCLAAAAFCCVSACGAGGGTSTELPAGPPTSAAPGNLVLYVAMAQGDRIDAYRLGVDGLLPSNPFDTIFVENPRRLAIADGVLHAALGDRIISLTLGEDGSLPAEPSAESEFLDNYEPNEIIVENGVLYVAATGRLRVESYRLDENNLIPTTPTGSGTGSFRGNYVSLELTDGILYAGARRTSNIDVFVLEEDGDVPTAAEDVDPQDRVALADEIVVRDGILYVTSGTDKSIRAYRIRNDGTLPDDFQSRTATEEFYSAMLLNGDLLYASAYNAGRIDVYDIDANGMLPEESPTFRTAADPASYPNELLLHGGILYAAQAGLDRVDAFIIDQNGLPASFPSSSTRPQEADSFPADLAMHELD